MFLGKTPHGISLILGTSSIIYTYTRTSKLDPEVRGSLFVRIAETAKAFLKTGSLDHANLVLNLSSKSFAAKTTSTKNYTDVTSSFSSHLITHPSIKRSEAHEIYRFDISDLGTSFIYSGPTNRIHDSNTRQDVLQGNYVRCKKPFDQILFYEHTPIKSSNSKGISMLSRRQVHVIITGTKNPNICNS